MNQRNGQATMLPSYPVLKRSQSREGPGYSNIPTSPLLVSLVPSNLATPPHLWSVKEVKAWLEFCDEEFALSPVCVDKFEMNGKALCLLKRKDFMERAPHAGDVLYNAFQRLRQQESPDISFLTRNKSPHFPPSATHHILPSGITDNQFGYSSTPSQSARQPMLHLLPKPPQMNVSNMESNPRKRKKDMGVNSNYGYEYVQFYSDKYKNYVAACNKTEEDGPPIEQGVPTSMLSPAASDSDSSHNDNINSPPSDKHGTEMENMTQDSGDDLHCEATNPQDDGVCRLLWEFIYQLLQEDKFSDLVCWESQPDLTFRINNPTGLAEMWGMQKNRSNMTYEKLSRALRYYYKMNIIQKVIGKRLTYRFLQHPTKIRKGQRGARPHSSRLLATSASKEAVIDTVTTFTDSYMPSTSCPQSVILNDFDNTDSPRPLMISEGQTEEPEHSSPGTNALNQTQNSSFLQADMPSIKSNGDETWTSRDTPNFLKTEHEEDPSVKCKNHGGNQNADTEVCGNSNNGSTVNDDSWFKMGHLNGTHQRDQTDLHCLQRPPPLSSPPRTKDDMSPFHDYLRRASSTSPLASSFRQAPYPLNSRSLTPSDMNPGSHKLVRPYPLHSSPHYLEPKTPVRLHSHLTESDLVYREYIDLDREKKYIHPLRVSLSTFHHTELYRQFSRCSNNKVDLYEEEDEGPQDLSMKPSYPLKNLIKETCNDALSVNQKPMKRECPPDSPLSSSTDSSYSSDRADYRKETAAESPLLPVKEPYKIAQHICLKTAP